MMTDTKNPSYTTQKLIDMQQATSRKTDEFESMPSKILHRVYDKYLKPKNLKKQPSKALLTYAEASKMNKQT